MLAAFDSSILFLLVTLGAHSITAENPHDAEEATKQFILAQNQLMEQAIFVNIDRKFSNLRKTFSRKLNKIESQMLRSLELTKESFNQKLLMTESKMDTVVTNISETFKENVSSCVCNSESLLTDFRESIEELRPLLVDLLETIAEDPATDSVEINLQTLSTKAFIDSKCFSLKFIPENKFNLSENPVQASFANEEGAYICRVATDEEYLIGKASFNPPDCLIALQNNEIGSMESDSGEYQILTNPEKARLFWKLSFKGQDIPRGSIVGSYGVTGERNFIGRCRHGNQFIPGPISESTGDLTITFDGKVVKCSQYEILMCY